MKFEIRDGATVNAKHELVVGGIPLIPMTDDDVWALARAALDRIDRAGLRPAQNAGEVAVLGKR